VKSDARVLFTTPYKAKFDAYDYHYADWQDVPVRLTNPIAMPTGLRFIKQNIPQIELLQYPTWEEYARELKKGWDVVGFSFYTRETDEILRMIDYARKMGVKTIWGGNYGVLYPPIQSAFDKVFVGYAEHQIAEELGMELGEIVHPPLVEGVGLKPLGFPLSVNGWLYTVRGCPLKCTFCQAPAVQHTSDVISIDAIERVVRYYKETGVPMVNIYDETFGIIPKHAREVVHLLREYEMPWGVMTRVDVLKTNFDEWLECGMIGAFVGLESLNAEILKDIKKRVKIEDAIKVIKLLHQNDCLVLCGYMIGFEPETRESVAENFRELRELAPDVTGIYVATPYPDTELWDETERKYGIDTSDWSKFDRKSIVWKHPNMSQEDIDWLLTYGNDLLNSPKHVFSFVKKLNHRILQQKGLPGLLQFVGSALTNRLGGGADLARPAYFGARRSSAVQFESRRRDLVSARVRNPSVSARPG